MNTEFEWDLVKAEYNLLKHGVAFAEAATVFFDPLSITVPDPLHSGEEDRFVTTGLSYGQRHLEWRMPTGVIDTNHKRATCHTG